MKRTYERWPPDRSGTVLRGSEAGRSQPFKKFGGIRNARTSDAWLPPASSSVVPMYRRGRRFIHWYVQRWSRLRACRARVNATAGALLAWTRVGQQHAESGLISQGRGLAKAMVDLPSAKMNLAAARFSFARICLVRA